MDVTKIGGQEHVGKIGGGYKAQGSKSDHVQVISPDGEAHWFSPSNARDLVRRNEGWRIAAPANITPWDASTTVAVAKPVEQRSEVTTDEKKPGEPTNELETLRVEADGLGIPYDLRWGKRRLAAEIETAKELAAEAAAEEAA